MPVSSERPAHSERSVKTVRAIGVKVCCPQRFAVSTQPIHLMLRGAQLEVFRQLETDSDRTIVSNRHHGCGVSELGNISSEAKFGFEEEKEMARRGAAERLKFDVSAEKITRVRGTQGSCAAGTGRLWEGATAKVGLVVRRRHGEIRITANPVARKECPRLFRALSCVARINSASL